MKRKISKIEEDENRVSKLLFSKPDDFAHRLKTKTENTTNDDTLLPAWIDEDDETININANVQKFVTLVGTPKWAKFNRKVKQEDGEEEDASILNTVGHLQKLKSIMLKKDFLEIKRLPKINPAGYKQGILHNVEFHPKTSVILLVGGTGVVSLYSLSNGTCNKLHNFALQQFKVSNCHFTPSGKEAYISSMIGRDYCIYDLGSAKPKLVSLPSVIKHANIFVISPDGKYLAISDGLDEVYFVCTMSNELLRVLKNNSKVRAVAFNCNSDILYCFCEGGEVTVWDLSTYRIQHKFFDNGCITPSCIKMSLCGRYLATGSGEGIVNVYEAANLKTPSPSPLHVIQNLQTKITEMKFNSSSEILAIASSVYPNAVKLVHVPSFQVFQNFPNQNSGLTKIGCLSFSPNSGYMALGNEKTALLYRLNHFGNY